MTIVDLTNFPERELYGQRRTDYPLPNCPNHRVVECHYFASLDQYERKPLSEPWTEDATLVLVSEEVEKQEGNGIWYVRKWANVPESWSDSSSYAMTYPAWDAPGAPSRPAFTRNVPAKIQKDYFLTDSPWRNPGGIATLRPIFFTDPTTGAKVQVLTTTSDYLFYAAGMASNVPQVAEESTFERYAGNIWCRSTIMVRVL